MAMSPHTHYPSESPHTHYPSEEMFQDISAFHEKFGLVYSGPARTLPHQFEEFRTKFMAEELAEYVTSDPEGQKQIISTVLQTMQNVKYDVPSLEKQFDALIDLVYVAMGTAYLHGFAFDEGWRRVHAANMAKVRALKEEDSLRGSTFDVVKPEGWTPPDLSDLVRP